MNAVLPDRLVLKDSIGCSRKVGGSFLDELKSLGILDSQWDDAAVVRPLGDSVVASVDLVYFPCADIVAAGEIIAAHCVNDVVAKGAEPLAALSVIMYPAELDSQGIPLVRSFSEGLRRVGDRLGFSIIGGHTVHNSQCVAGLAVIGKIREHGSFIPKRGMLPGDRLILTKPLGSLFGLFAVQAYSSQGESLEAAAIENMRKLHPPLPHDLKIRSCTDISGYGLIGHLCEMLEGSGFGAKLSTLPSILPQSLRGMWHAPMCALERNAQAFSHFVSSPDFMQLDHRLYSPETSGPMLMAVPGEMAHPLLNHLINVGLSDAQEIGEVTATAGIIVTP